MCPRAAIDLSMPDAVNHAVVADNKWRDALPSAFARNDIRPTVELAAPAMADSVPAPRLARAHKSKQKSSVSLKLTATCTHSPKFIKSEGGRGS